MLTLNALLVGGTASYQTAALSAGVTHAVTATYNGDTNFNAVSIPLASAVQQAVQSGNVTLTVTPSTYSTSLNTSVIYTIVASTAPPLRLKGPFPSTTPSAGLPRVSRVAHR